jgi:GAF domain-containing protein
VFHQTLQEELHQTSVKLGASSCTLYVQDPQWPGEFRLIGMAGVRFPEPMFGFVYADTERRLLSPNDKELFVCLPDERERQNESLIAEIPFSNRRLFGGFQEREGVMSFARLIENLESDTGRVVLFINFSTSLEFTDREKEDMRTELLKLVDVVRSIRTSLIAADLEWRSEATRISSPGTTVSSYALEEPGTFFSKVIEAALQALNIPAGSGLGVIHLYNAELQLLELRGSYGEIQYPERARGLSVRTGEGLISCVALTKRSILVQDLAKSEFKRIHVWLHDRTCSELVVPLEIEGELVGTMCLESTRRNSFVPHHALSVWFAANKAALAYQLHQLSSMNRKLLDLCWRATAVEGASVSLDDLATLARDYLQASTCDISRYNPDTGTFDKGAASFGNFTPQVRSIGWTHFIRMYKNPVWISEIQGPHKPTVHVWHDDRWEAAQGENFPIGINQSAIDAGVRSALGVPVNVRDDCIGVAWIKYLRPHGERPKRGLMALAVGFAAEAGLVLDSFQRREVDLKEKAKIDFVADQVSTAIHERWQLKDSSIVDCHVITRPLHSRLGGDFYAGKVVDAQTVGILLLDGQGHGVGGSLHMLPLMTAFESVYNSYSAAHVVSQLAKTAETLGVKGSAIYCVLSSIENKRWLIVTSAGHESLILLRSDRGRWSYTYFPNFQSPMLGHPLSEPFMDHRVLVLPDDVIVGYTDGIAEQNKPFNATHVATLVANLLNENNQAETSSIAEAIVDESRKKHSLAFDDDATVFVARVK